MTILAKHLHSNDDPHRLTAVNDLQLRCWDCKQTLDLTAALTRTAAKSTSSTSLHPITKDEAECPLHVGQRAGYCGPCRSELIAVPEPAPDLEPQEASA